MYGGGIPCSGTRLLLTLLVAWAAPAHAVPAPAPNGPAPGPPDRVVQFVDAVGNAMAEADVAIVRNPQDGAAPVRLRTNAGGVVTLPGGPGVVVEVSHEAYGTARVDLAQDGGGNIMLPLVQRNSDAHRRALHGLVVDANRNPIAGASVRCDHVRTPGEGLISAGSQASVMTGKDGRFSLYLPDATRRMQRFGDFDGPDKAPERGELIPVNSKFSLRIDVPGDPRCFPTAGAFSNVDQATVRLERPAKARTLKFEDHSGGVVTDPEKLRYVRIYYTRPGGGDRFALPERYAAGGHLAAGRYDAENDRVRYQPLVVSDDSADELIVRRPPAITFAGRVVDGVGGNPVAGAFVIGMTGTGQESLAGLGTEAWAKLEALPAKPDLNDPAVALLRDIYTIDAIARTDDAGRYEITQKPGQEIYGLIAFARDGLPLMHRLYQSKPDAKHRAEVRDIPLYPAARVTVRPVFAAERGSTPNVSPHWVIDPQGQPDWRAAFEKAADGGERQFQYQPWLKLNQPNPVFVPAGLRLRLRLETPYNDEWSLPDLAQPIQLERGKSLDLGNVSFVKSLDVTVLVLDDRGRPVEGAPIRMLRDRVNVWSIAHNTDARGLARFQTPPNSTGRFGAPDLAGPGQPPPNLDVPYQTGEASDPSQPIVTIRLTAPQVERLKGPRPGAV